MSYSTTYIVLGCRSRLQQKAETTPSLLESALDLSKYIIAKKGAVIFPRETTYESTHTCCSHELWIYIYCI